MAKSGAFKTIPEADSNITSFKAFKSWSFNTTGSLDLVGIDRYVGIKPNPDVYNGSKPTLNTWQVVFDSASLLVNSKNDKEASLMWYSLNHLYYKRSGQPFETFGNTNHYSISRALFNDASIISIPQKCLGEGIKPSSVKLHLKNTQLNSVSMLLVDDGNGNLINTSLSSSISNEVIKLDFNRSKYEINWTNDISKTSLDISSTPIKFISTKNDFNVCGTNIWLTSQYQLPGNTWNNSAYFHGNGYIRISNDKSVNFKRDDNFAISFFVNRHTVSNTDEYIISKRTTGYGNSMLNSQTVTGDVQLNISQYPFEILFPANSQTILVKQSNGSVISSISAPFNINEEHHICLQKRNNNLDLYVDSSLISTVVLPNGDIHNAADIFIGSLGLDANKNGVLGLTGTISNVIIFNKHLSQSEISQLSNLSLSLNTNVVGNVFYEHGIIVLTDPRPKYGTESYKMFADVLYNRETSLNETSYLSEFYLEYNSTVTLFEHEYICKINEDEFNFTSNPTIRNNNDEQSEIPKSFVANSEFSPYITTVGLYSKNGELIAIGKLGTPIKKRDNVDLAIVVRFDI